jgi:hypothetical protein
MQFDEDFFAGIIGDTVFLDEEEEIIVLLQDLEEELLFFVARE